MIGEPSHPFPSPGDRPGAAPVVRVAFATHVELLRTLLARRDDIVERVERLLNAQRKPAHFLQDVPLLARHFDECFFALPGLGAESVALERQLDEAHWASGFKPRHVPGHPNDLVDAAELMSRAFLMWQRTRWPGHHGRVGYAHTLFNVYLLRRLMLLAMRIWDEGSATDRLAHVQGVLDELWRTTPADQPVFVRDARWLFALAQSPTTDELHGYLIVAERVEQTLPEQDRVEISSASVRMAGGHLRSQLRHVSTQKGVSIDQPSLVASTRKSNALDVATLVQGLVPLLHAYEHASNSDDAERRLELADAICQGISPDPELFLNRLELLGPYSIIEHLFIAADSDGHAGYSPMGQRHLRLLDEYAALIPRVAEQLHADCVRFRPVDGRYSPYGVLYGFSSRLLEHMGLKAAQPNTATRFSLEDVFAAGEADKLAWVSGWRKLPHVPREVVKLFEYPQRFAEEVFERVERALRRREGAEASAAVRTGKLFVVRGADSPPDPRASSLAKLSVEFVLSTDREVVAANDAIECDEAALLHSRLEGEFIVSYRTPGGWVAVSKDLLTDVLGAGRDARLDGLPIEEAHRLTLACPGLAVLA